MKFSDAFHRTSTAYPDLLDWHTLFSWQDPTAATAIQELHRAQLTMQYGGGDGLIKFSELIRSDLIEQSSLHSAPPSAGTIDVMRFIISQPAIQFTLAKGQLGDCYSWVHWAISRDHDPSLRLNHATYSLPPFADASGGMNRYALSFLIHWITAMYLLARKFGGLDRLAETFLDYSIATATAEAASANLEAGVDALTAITNWVTSRSNPHESVLVRILMSIFAMPHQHPRVCIAIGLTFSTAAARWTGKRPTDWATYIYQRFNAYLIEHEAVQLLSVMIHDQQAWDKYRAALLLETRKLSLEYSRNAGSGIMARLSLESRVSVLHPAIFALCKFGKTEDLMDLLWAWYGRDNWIRADANILFICPNHGEGVAYIWPSGRWLTSNAGQAGSLEQLMICISDALNEYIRGPSGDREQLFDQRLAGTPARQQGDVLHDQMKSHYKPAELISRLPADFRPRSIVVMPAHRDPLQGLLVEHRLFAPIEATLARAAFSRPTKKVNVWPGSTQTTAMEVAMLQAVASKAGWELHIVQDPLDAIAFDTFYRDEDADVLWVIGHGEYSPYRPYESGLIIENERLLPIPHIADIEITGEGRRLLVLNICSGGAAQNLGGMAIIGLSQMLVSPSQQVISHLWPIDYYAALAFGCAFAIKLANDEPGKAFSEGINLMRDQSSLLDCIRTVCVDLEAVQRLTGDTPRTHIENFLSWGCPVMLT